MADATNIHESPSPPMHKASPRRSTREPCVLLEDLTEGLLWPTLLRVPALAFRPERLGLGVLAVVLIGLIGGLNLAWMAPRSVPDQWAASFAQLMTDLTHGQHPWPWTTDSVLDIGAYAGLVVVSFYFVLERMILTMPLSVLLLGPLMLAVWAVLSGAISRSVASELALSRVPHWTNALGIAASRWFSLFAALLVPLVLIGLIRVVMIVAGGVLLNVPVLDVIGSVLYPIAWGFGLLAVLVGVAYALGGWMLVPAVMCEGSDALDAIQRSFAYVAGRPVRLVLYLLVLLVQGLIVFWLFQGLMGLAIRFVDGSLGVWGGGATGALSDTPGGPAIVAHWVFGFWKSVIAVLAAGFAVSYIATGSTALYLVCRRANDGQDMTELWEPTDR